MPTTTLRIAFVCDAAAPIAAAHRSLLDERLSAYGLDIHMVHTASFARTAIQTRIAHVVQCEGRYVGRCANSIRLATAHYRPPRCGFVVNNDNDNDNNDNHGDEDASSEAWTRLVAAGAWLVVATVALEPLDVVAVVVVAPAASGDDVCMLSASDPFALPPDAFGGAPDSGADLMH